MGTREENLRMQGALPRIISVAQEFATREDSRTLLVVLYCPCCFHDAAAEKLAFDSSTVSVGLWGLNAFQNQHEYPGQFVRPYYGEGQWPYPPSPNSSTYEEEMRAYAHWLRQVIETALSR